MSFYHGWNYMKMSRMDKKAQATSKKSGPDKKA